MTRLEILSYLSKDAKERVLKAARKLNSGQIHINLVHSLSSFWSVPAAARHIQDAPCRRTE